MKTLNDSQIKEIFNFYKRALIIQKKENGWPGWKGFSTPGRSMLSYEMNCHLPKITFEITTNIKEPSEKEIDLILEKEIRNRIKLASQPFTSGIFNYFTRKEDLNMQGYLDSIENLIQENADEICKALENSLEYPLINEFFQRIKDYQTCLNTRDFLIQTESDIIESSLIYRQKVKEGQEIHIPNKQPKRNLKGKKFRKENPVGNKESWE